MWVPGFEYIPGATGGVFANDVADKLLLHTTEGNSISGAIGAYTANNSWPHFTVDPLTCRKVQHLDTARSAMALYNGPGGIETNRAGTVIQVEIIGFAGSTHTYSDAWYQWLAVEVIRPLCEAHGIPARMMRFYGTGEGYVLATESWPGRLWGDQWNNYCGILGHQNVGDGNDHWDPGRLDSARLLSMAFGGGEIVDPISGAVVLVGAPVPGPFVPVPPSIPTTPDPEDPDLMASAAEILAELQALRSFVHNAFQASVEAYPTPSGQWRTSVLDGNGQPTHGGIVLPHVSALIFEAATATRVEHPPARVNPPAAPMTAADHDAIAAAVVRKLAQSLGR